jgi:hypothetical protein
MLVKRKKGQVAIFVIIALVIVAGILFYFLIRGNLVEVSEIPAELAPVFNFYSECIKEEVRAGVDLAGTQGGYVSVNEIDYLPGSEYAPFSSQLNFLGFPVPYWYYVTGNGLIKEQVPSKVDIENGIGEFVAERLNNCNFENFYEQGFDIGLNEVEVEVNLFEEKIDVKVNSGLLVRKGEVGASRSLHEVSVNSKLGKFYNLARVIYNRELEEAFLEEYAVDVLRLYAPVDGVELSCSSEIWRTRDVVNDLYTGLEANMGALKLGKGYYTLDDKKDEYFVLDEGIDEAVQVLFSRNWPNRVEIYGEGVDDELMIAEPVGIQEGLGILGFCYAPYHFVYDVSFPVLVQIYNENELFQFPFVVVIDKNLGRNGIVSEIDYEEEFDFCSFYTQDVEVNVYDINLNEIDGAKLDYQCFNQRCNLGETEDGIFKGKSPSCINGYLMVRAQGYTDKKQLFSTNEERVADVILDREFEVSVDLEIGGKKVENGTAIITFEKNDGGRTVSAALPEFDKIKLSEGQYEVRVFAYSDSDIKISGGTKRQCTDVPKEGLLGFLGGSKERCFDITTPDTEIEFALIGGGRSNVFVLESEIEKGAVVVKADRLPTPKSLEDLQFNFESYERNGLEVVFNEN